jgi:hypothetical protein
MPPRRLLSLTPHAPAAISQFFNYSTFNGKFGAVETVNSTSSADLIVFKVSDPPPIVSPRLDNIGLKVQLQGEAGFIDTLEGVLPSN